MPSGRRSAARGPLPDRACPAPGQVAAAARGRRRLRIRTGLGRLGRRLRHRLLSGCFLRGRRLCRGQALGRQAVGRLRRRRRGADGGSRLAYRWPALLRSALLAWLCRLLGRKRLDDRPDVQPCRLPQVAGLAAVVARHGDHQVVAVDHHLGPGHTEPVDARGDDLLGLVQRVGGRPRSVGRTRGQGHPGAALQVDAQLRLGLLVAGQEDQQVHADQQREEKCQVAGRVHRRRRRCHVSLISSKVGSSAPQRVRACAESPTVSR